MNIYTVISQSPWGIVGRCYVNYTTIDRIDLTIYFSLEVSLICHSYSSDSSLLHVCWLLHKPNLHREVEHVGSRRDRILCTGCLTTNNGNVEQAGVK